MEPVSEYKKRMEDALRRGDATEHTHRPALKALVEALASGVVATNEPRRVECGAPDYSVSRRSGYGPLTIGYVEAKDVGTSLDEARKGEQVQRYLRALPNLVLTDYLEFRWYVDGELRSTARLARVGADNRLKLEARGGEEVAALLGDFLARAPEPVANPRDLAQRMARLAHMVRDIIVRAFAEDKASEMMIDLRRAFAQALIPDLMTPEKSAEFADMYAQTIAYGLFAARCNHRGPGPFRRVGAAAEIPKTNPFLRRLFETLTGTELDDEPYAGFVDDLVGLLSHADMAAVLEHFGTQTRRQDPVVHFYETFLAAYDPRLRETRGVYYTPEPVVSYIVRSVDEILKTRFGCDGGLADTAEVEYERRENGEKRKAKAQKVLILDPACGTGTFLYAVVDHIREQFMTRRDAGMWSAYVKEHLLPRLLGFELLMAPYAVAHLKLGMQLGALDLSPAERESWEYSFTGDERLGVYLTNTLEEAERRVDTLFGPYRVIADEGNAASRVKRDMPIMAVIGNPPYSGHSANRSWEMKDKKRVPTFIGKLVRDYYWVDGKPLDEKNPKWLQDDYVKFIRWGQWRIEQTGAGVLAFITNHGYLDNPTFRGMRQVLMNAFDEIYIMDLHGNQKKKERAPDGSKDENVFDIQQGTAIGIFVRHPKHAGPATVYHADLYGPREHKYQALKETDTTSTQWRELSPASPFYLLTHRDTALHGEYEAGWKVTDVFPVHASGVTTARNEFAMAYERETLISRVRDLMNESLDDREIRERYGLKDVSYWRLRTARTELTALTEIERYVEPYAYRPFDNRFVFYHNALCERLRPEVMQHMRATSNVAFLTHRPQSPQEFSFAYCTRLIGDQCVAARKRAGGGNTYQFPLYLVPSNSGNHVLHDRAGNSLGARRPNLNPQFIAELERRLGLVFVADGTGDLRETFGPEDVFHYIYAVFHSPTYRERYSEFLKMDFPRVPLTSDAGLFRRLCELGAELTALHLLESPKLNEPITHYPIAGSNVVEKGFQKYVAPGEPEPGTGKRVEDGRVYVNKKQYYGGVPQDVWEFHVGGYQVCEKWLKDRRGRELSYADRVHYQEVILALRETIRLMAEIDAAIPSWPIR